MDCTSDDGRDVVLMIESADRSPLESVRYSIVHFGLAEYDERRRGFLVKRNMQEGFLTF
jgi:hypothetical protein